MALSQSALSSLLDAIRAGGSEDVLRDAMTLVLQELIELEAAQAIGAGRYERTDERTTHRNGGRGRLLSTKTGDIELRIPKLRTGSFFPALLDPRQRRDTRTLGVDVDQPFDKRNGAVGRVRGVVARSDPFGGLDARGAGMTTLRVAAVQATYVLMDREGTIDRVAELTAAAAAQGAQLVVFPEVFIPGTPIWIDTQPIWDGDADWFRLLAENTVVVPGPATDRLGAIAREHGVWLVIGVEEKEPNGATIYNSVLYLSPEGTLIEKHRKLMPTGAERTVWGMGDGSTLRAVDTSFGRVGGLICWENYMPLARFHMYAQGIDLWLAPTLATGDAWIATMQHLARENRMFVVGVNPVLHVDRIPSDFPHRNRLVPAGYLAEKGLWLEEGNTVIVGPGGEIIAGPVRQQEETLVADLDLGAVAAARRLLDPVGHYNRPDVFRLHVDTSPRPAVVVESFAMDRD